jgi:sodium transport system permease protein
LNLVLPILLYPGILLLMGIVISAGKDRLKSQGLVVAVTSDEASALLAQKPTPAHTTYQRFTRAAAEEALREKKVAAIVEARPTTTTDLAAGRQAEIFVLYSKRYDSSMQAVERLRSVLDGLNAELLATRLREQKLDDGFATPLKIEVLDLDFQKNLGPLLASRMLPTLLLTMLFLGALYAAVDTTAGEKERGTFETLLVSSVRPVDILVAKYITVSLVAIVSALVNLGAMAATFGVGFAFDDRTTTQLSFSVVQLLTLLVCMIPAAFLVSAVSLAVAATARTTREGQSWMSPVMLIGILPALLTQMPGFELSTFTALVPILNVALLVKAVALGTAQPLHVGLTVVSVTASAILALRVAARVFNSETVRFGSAPFSDVFRRKR